MYPASFEACRLLECLDIITSIMCLHKRTFQYLFSLAPVLFVPSHMHMDINVCFQIRFFIIESSFMYFWCMILSRRRGQEKRKNVMYASALYTLTSCVTGLVALCTFHNCIYSFIGSLWQHTIDLTSQEVPWNLWPNHTKERHRERDRGITYSFEGTAVSVLPHKNWVVSVFCFWV